MRKRLWKKVLSVSCAVSMFIATSGLDNIGWNFGMVVQGEELVDDGLWWEVTESGTVCIIKYTGNATKVNIPAEIDGYRVTEISDWAFKDTNLESVVLPEGLQSIGYAAFGWCKKLKNINLPESLQSIGDYAFYYCESLKGIDLPESLQSIGYAAFGTTGLISIDLPEGLQSVEDWTFGNCESLTSVNLPKDLQSIGYSAFGWCTSLKNIEFPEGLQSIGKDAFYNCESLISVEFPEGLQSIGDGAFCGCDSLTSIILPEGLQSIEDDAFYDCRKLISVDLPEGLQNIGEEAFYACTSLTSIELPGSLQSIGKSAFSSATALYVIKNSYAEKYAIDNLISYNYYKNANSTNNVLTFIPVAKYGFSFCDAEELKTVNNITVTYNNEVLELSDGIVIFEPIEGADILYVKYNGITLPYNLSHFSTGKIHKVILPSSGTNTVFSYLHGTYQGNNYDLLNMTAQLEKGNNDNYFCLNYMVVGDDITQIKVTQQNKVLASTTNIGESLKIDIQSFSVGGNITIEVVKNNVCQTIPLNVRIVASDSETAVALEGDSLKFTVSENIPILGGTELEFEMPELPVQLYASGSTVRIGFNVKDDLLDDKTLSENLKRTIEDVVSDYKKGKKEKKDELAEYRKNNESKPTGQGKSEFSIIGYGEVTNPEGFGSNTGEVKVNVNLIIEYTAGYEVTGQYYVLAFPVTVVFGIEGSVAGVFAAGYNLTTNQLDGTVTVKGEIGIDAYGGAGWGKILSGGVYGNGKLAMVYNVLSSEAKTGLQQLVLSGEMGLRGYALGLKGEVPILSKDYYLYPQVEATSDLETATAKLYNSANYEVDTTTYNNELSAQAEGNVLIENVYSAADPQIVTIGDKLVMVYRTTSEERESVNQSTLVYAVKDLTTGTWSDPQPVWDDGTLDWDFEFVSDGENVWLVYQNADEVFTSDYDIDTMATHLDLDVQKLNTETMTFDNPQEISGEGYNYLPSVYVENGNAYFAWVHNDTADYFATNTGNSVQYRAWEDVLGDIQTLDSGLNVITDIQIGHDGNAEQIAYTVDDDNDLTTSAGTLKVKATDGTLLHEETGVINIIEYSNSSDVQGFLWTNENTLKSLDEATDVVSILWESSAIAGGEILYENGYLYMKSYDVEGGSVIRVRELNAEALELEVLQSDNRIDYFDVVGDRIVYVDTVTTIGEDTITSESALMYEETELVNKQSIAVSAVEVTGYDMSVENGIPVVVTVKNDGMGSIDSYTVEILDGEGTVLKTETVDTVLESGCEAEVNMVVDSDLISANTEYSVVAKLISEAETICTSEAATFMVDKAELAVDTVLGVNSNGYFIQASVTNHSPVPTSGTLTFTDSNGEVIHSQAFYVLRFEETLNVLAQIDEKYYGQVITVSAECEGEYYTYNNLCEEYLQMLETSEPLTIVGTSDTSAINVGEKLTLTGSATGGDGEYIYSYLVYNKTTNQWARLTSAFTANNTFTWTAGSAGNRVFYVEVKDSTGEVVRSEAIAVNVTEEVEEFAITGKASASTVPVGAKVTLTGSATGGDGDYTYSYLVYNKTTNQWARLTSSFTANNTFTWTAGSAGNRLFYVEAKDGTGKVVRSKAITVNVTADTQSLAITAKASKSSVTSKAKVTFTGTASGGDGGYTYSYLVYNQTTNQWARLTPSFISSNTFTWTAGSIGKRKFFVEVKDCTGKVVRSSAVIVTVNE